MTKKPSRPKAAKVGAKRRTATAEPAPAKRRKQGAKRATRPEAALAAGPSARRVVAGGMGVAAGAGVASDSGGGPGAGSYAGAGLSPAMAHGGGQGTSLDAASGLGSGLDARADVLDRLWRVVTDRRSADPAVSHSARLLSRGTAKVAQKFGEEAVECVIEAVAGNRAALIAESADVLYHLLVMWVDAGLPPHAVWQELERREGVSGVAEKAARRRSLPTTKIP